jgi:hypothetical protein
MILTSFNEYLQGSFLMTFLSGHSSRPLLTRNIIRVNKVLANSRELNFALIKTPINHKRLSSVARCFSERPYQQPAQRHNAEKRQLIAGIENLWDKCAVSSQAMESDRETTLGQLNGFLSGLGYLG